MADSNGDIKDQEREKVTEGEKSEPSNSEQPTASTEEDQSAEQGQPAGSEEGTSSELPKDTETENEGKEMQGEEKGATEGQSETVEGEKTEEGEKGEGEAEATEESSDVNKPSDVEEQPASGNKVTATEDEEKAGEEVSSDGGQVAREEGERDGEKPQESTLDKDDQVEGEGEAAKSDPQAQVEDDSLVKDTEQPEDELRQQEEGEVAEEGTKVKWDESGPAAEETGVVGMEVLNEPLADILEEDEELEPVDREELLAATKEVILEQERLKSVSAQLQHKIAEYLAKKKTEERPDPGRNVTDQEKRYKQCMAALEMFESDLETMQQRAELQDAQLLALREQKLAQVRKATEEFAEYKKGIATTAVHSRAGRRLRTQEVEQFQAAEDKKESELTLVRLENIKLQNKISKLESMIKEKDQLAEGLHMIDFEQLKINNVDLNEKIEERNEDILKLRKKVTSTVQVLTHVKEKLQFLQAENGEKRTALRNIDEIVAKKRDHLTRMKQARDALRIDNNRLKQRGGLVGHPALLGDFEQRKDQNDELRVVLERLQQRHSELTVACDGFRKKVEQAKTIHPRNL